MNEINADFLAADGSGGFRLLGWNGVINGDKLTLKLKTKTLVKKAKATI